MIISNKEFDKVNARNVELARQLNTIDNILRDSDKDNTPAVLVIDKIKEAIRG